MAPQPNGEKSDRSRQGMREFLANFLSDDEVSAVLKSTTCGLVTAKTKDEGIAEIVKWSDAVTMLNRQRVKKDYLLRYLIKKDIKASMKDTKTALCQAVLNYWQTQSPESLKNLEFPESTQKPKLSVFGLLKVVPSTSKTIIKEAKPKPEEIPNKSTIRLSKREENKPPMSELSKPPEAKKLKPDEILADKPCSKAATTTIEPSLESDNDENKSAKEASIPKPIGESTAPPETSTCTTVALLTENILKENIIQNKAIVATCEVGTNTDPCTSLSLDADDSEFDDMAYELCVQQKRKELELGHELGLQFSRWYYQRFNSMEDFIAAHFMKECNLRVEYITNNVFYNSRLSEFLYDGQRCYEEMCYLRTKKNLYLNPNLMTGVRGKMNPHGLAQIVVCGTFHYPDAFGTQVGVFDQVFGLMRDPSCFGTDGSDNFKIKFSMLRLREESHIIKGVDQPTAVDVSLNGILEEAKDCNKEEQAIEEYKPCLD